MTGVMQKLLGLFQPSSDYIQQLSAKDWENIVRVAREGGVLGRLYHIISDANLLEVLPDYALKHLESASLYAARQGQQVKYECKLLVDLLGDEFRTQHLFLKGTAYVLSDSPVGRGRTFSDIDLLVKKSSIEKTEQMLMLFGWFQDEKSDYDQRYYRNWSHEIPPLKHAVRGTVLDLHHNIVPPVSGRAPDVSILWDTGQGQEDGTCTMSPAAQALHSMVHLFFQEDFSNGFRDLSDLDILFRSFGDDAFWQQLCKLAEKTGFTRELHFATRYCKRVFSTPVPQDIEDRVARYAPAMFKAGILDWAFEKVLMPHHSAAVPRGFGIARWLLFVRGHSLKMPLHILLYHTLSKTSQTLYFLITGRDKRYEDT